MVACLTTRYVADQRNMGMSMKVERSSLSQVQQRFEMNKRKAEEKAKAYDFNERVRDLQEEVTMSVTVLL